MESCKESSKPGVVSLTPSTSKVESIVITSSGSLRICTGGPFLVCVDVVSVKEVDVQVLEIEVVELKV